MHPDHAHMTANVDDPEAAAERRLEIARSAGVPEEPLRLWAQAAARQPFGIAGIVEPARELLPGVARPTSGGGGRADPGRRALARLPVAARAAVPPISGHRSGRVSPYFDYGYLPDPVGEFLTSLDRVEALDARLGLSGHGRTFGDVQGHIAANRELISQRLAALEDVLREDGTVTAFDAVPGVFGEAMTPNNANWRLSETLCYLRHLQVTG